MDIDEIMRTTWANRRYLPAPVPGEVIYRVLNNARFAPRVAETASRGGWW